MSLYRSDRNGIIPRFVLSLVLSIIFFPNAAKAQPLYEELMGYYTMVYDSTHIWPDGNGGYDYVRYYKSEIVLAERGRTALSRTATPVLGKNDRIDIKAFTVLPDGEIFQSDEEDIVTRNITDDSKRIFINFRHAEPGAALHLEWTIRSTDASIAGKRFFGKTIPVDSAIVVLTIPDSWVFKFAVSPAFPAYEIRERFKGIGGSGGIKYKWIAADVQGLYDEEFSPTFEEIIPGVFYSLYLDRNWPDPETQKVDWLLISRLYGDKLENFLESGSSLDPVIDSLENVSGDIRHKAAGAFTWVRRNFRSQYSDVTLARSVDDAIEKRRGTQGNSAAILYGLLEDLNVPCGLYLTATRNVTAPLDELPALFWFDRLIVACFIDGDTLWADPFYPVSDLGVLPFEDQGASILRIDEPAGNLSRIPDVDYRENGKAIHLKLYLDQDGALHGEATEIYSGAMIPEISSYLLSFDEEQRKMPWERKLTSSFPGARLGKFIAFSPDSANDDYRIAYSFTTDPIIRPFARRAYMPMDLLGRWEDLPNIPDSQRRYPIMLKRPRFEFERITFYIAPQFEVESLPKNYSLNSHIGEIYSVARQAENSVTITRGFGLKKSYLPPSANKSLARFFNTARAEADKQIILKRTE